MWKFMVNMRLLSKLADKGPDVNVNVPPIFKDGELSKLLVEELFKTLKAMAEALGVDFSEVVKQLKGLGLMQKLRIWPMNNARNFCIELPITISINGIQMLKHFVYKSLMFHQIS